MPREIPSPLPQPPLDGVLIRRHTLKAAARHKRLDQQARQRARLILRETERDAAEIRRHAYQDGFQQGMLDALQQVAAYLAASREMAQHWRERLDDHARAMLSAAVDHPDTLLLLMDEWLRDIEQTDSALHLTLPENARAQQSRLMALLEEQWSGSIQVEFHADPRCIMRCADQVAEFAPELYIEPASRQLQQCLDTLSQDCRQISAHALEEFIAQWQTSSDGKPERKRE